MFFGNVTCCWHFTANSLAQWGRGAATLNVGNTQRDEMGADHMGEAFYSSIAPIEIVTLLLPVFTTSICFYYYYYYYYCYYCYYCYQLVLATSLATDTQLQNIFHIDRSL